MASTWRRWFKIGGIGCLGALGVVVLVLAVAYVFVRAAGERDIYWREELDRAQPDAATFTPPAEGRLAAERLDRFIAVRRRLAEECADFAEIEAALARMDSYAGTDASPAAAEPDLRRFSRDTGQALKAFVGVARRLAAYLEVRNRALLAAEMGLGEFTWIQVLAYHAWLGEPPRPFALAREEDPRIFQDRVVPQVREMIRRQLAAAAQAGIPAADLEPWRQELAALEADPERIPFAGGLPPGLAASLAPYWDALQSVWCPATAELDLTVTTRDGIGFEHL